MAYFECINGIEAKQFEATVENPDVKAILIGGYDGGNMPMYMKYYIATAVNSYHKPVAFISHSDNGIAEIINSNGRIGQFIKRYPNIPVGFSTHESPTDTSAIRVAYAKGARLFEKHVAIPTKEYKVNAYSATPEQVSSWLAAWKETKSMLDGEGRTTGGGEEQKSFLYFFLNAPI